MNTFLKSIGVLSSATLLISAPFNITDTTQDFSSVHIMQNKNDTEYNPQQFFDESMFTESLKMDSLADTDVTSDFPSSFDLRDSGLTQHIKHQGQYGTCWSITACDSGESSLIKNVPDIDLSEWHLAYYAYTGGEQTDIGDDFNTEKQFNHGGSSMVASTIWSQWKGPVTESKLPYGDLNICSDTDLQEKYMNDADYHLENAYLFEISDTNPEAGRQTVKEFLLNGQSVDISYCNLSSHYNTQYDSYMSGVDSDATHSVSIIGYDDNFPAENFNSDVLPENDGAWLVKNSWGNNWYDDGCFWISYEEPSLCEFAVFEFGDENNYTHNYQHDSFITSQTMAAGQSSTSYMANVFTAESNEWLQAVSTYFVAPNTDYEITIYKNLKRSSSPTSGTKVCTTTGTASVTGYQTVKLNKNIELSEGDTFSVVVKLTNTDNIYLIPTESCLAVIDSETSDIVNLSNHTKYEQIKAYTNRNESFFSSNGIFWTDVVDSDYSYTDTQKEYLYNQVVAVFGDDFASQFEENFGNDEVVIAKGNFPIKAFTNPVNHVDFSHNSGFVYDNETVELSCGNGEQIYYSVNGGDYIEYTEPLQITEECTISATTDFTAYSEKEYTPAYSMLGRLGYTFSSKVNAEYITPQADGNYVLDVDSSEESIMLLPISQGNITINGTSEASYLLTKPFALNYGENVFEISIETENAAPNTVTLTVNRGESSTTATTTTTTATTTTTTTKTTSATTTSSATTTPKNTTTTVPTTSSTSTASTTSSVTTTSPKTTTTTKKATTTTTKTSSTSATTTVSVPEIIYGDTNEDGKVTIADSVAVAAHISNSAKYPLTESQIRNADVHNTGNGLNANDAFAIQQFATGIINKFSF